MISRPMQISTRVGVVQAMVVSFGVRSLTYVRTLPYRLAQPQVFKVSRSPRIGKDFPELPRHGFVWRLMGRSPKAAPPCPCPDAAMPCADF